MGSNAKFADVAARLADALPGLTPELAKAATWVLEHPGEVGVGSVRAIAAAADVKPNTMVRMARAVGFDGFDDFRAPFRAQMRAGLDPFPAKARRLQQSVREGRSENVVSDMAAAISANTEAMFAHIDPSALSAAADAIIAARRTFVLGVGVANPLARNFAYLAAMALDTVSAIPNAGSLPADDLSRAGPDDILIAMTFKPYRREVVEAVETARAEGVPVIAISDSAAAPITAGAAHRFIVPTETPQAFTSTVALSAFLETLMALVIADADASVLRNVDRFHERRHRLGIYWQGES